MIKNIRSDKIFKKSEIQKIIRSKKNLSKDKKNEYKKFFVFSLTSFILILSFFSLPSINNYLSDNFAKKKLSLTFPKKNLS